MLWDFFSSSEGFDLGPVAFEVFVEPAGAGGDSLLLESGDFLLLESGDKLLLE